MNFDRKLCRSVWTSLKDILSKRQLSKKTFALDIK